MMRVAAMTVLFAAIAARAWATTGSAAAADDRPGRAFFAQAETKFKDGRYEDALVDYQAAYDAEPLPAFLFNIGQCYRNLGNYERAQVFFRRYTTLDPRSPNRPAAERLIAEMDKLAAQHSTAATAATAATYATNAEPADSAVPSLAAPPPATADRPAPTQPGAFMAQPAAAPSPPVYRRAWFWVAVSAVVVAGGVAAAFAVQRDDPHSSLRPIDTR